MERFLTNQEREQLKTRHRKEKDRRTGDRIKAVLLADIGWSWRQIAEALLLDEETVAKHVGEYKEHQKLSIQTGGTASKLNPEQTQELKAHLEAQTYLKAGDICAYVEEKHGIIYTLPGMTSWLKTHGFSYKKPKGTPAKADPVKQAAFIEAYEKLKEVTPDEEPILFGDGVHPTMATKISYGWILRGQEKPLATTGSRTRLNLMGALNLETMQAHIGSYETLDSNAMEAYFDILRKAYPKALNIHLILDQGPYNKSEQTRKAAEKRGIVLHFLPPYSPNLNPIERLWKVMNEHARNNRFFKTPNAFRDSIFAFFNTIWPRICMTQVDRINDNFQTLKSLVPA